MSRIAEIRMTGRGQIDAVIRFDPGPNVVSGDSDTGKSYLLRLVDYVLGADQLTKTIDEAAAYETVWWRSHCLLPAHWRLDQRRLFRTPPISR